ncbi:max-binding protein MNT [Coccinella septempunctata]|uniref:max-binding protein MNT n=1 Tax=Coccinella septempunctata TaxID=41139 RepID=UPI001D072031|nr:max-binding protein MNT [Coccinella septempunctata]XP_044763105.1 max-binding protein MNT [Coccinella septempunctata]
MSLDTLLEAAKYLELQEMMEKQSKAALSTTATVVTTANGLVAHPVLQKPITNIAPLNQQTLVITSHLPGAAQSVIHAPASSTETTNLLDKKAETMNRTRFIHNSFDIINPLYIDEKSNVAKRKPPPLVFRAGTREVHNKLEKHRRAHLKECFDILKKQLPASPDEKKTSNLNILHSAIRYIHILRKKERDLEQEMERLAREKISWQTKLALLKKDLSSHYENIDFNRLLAEVVPTAPEGNRRDSETESSVVDMKDEDSRTELVEEQHPHHSLLTTNGVKKLSLPILPSKSQGPVSSTVTSLKEVQQPVQTALSVVPVGYPLNQGLVLQKLAIVPKGITDLTPLVPTFITQQQLNGKVVPLVNAQYVVGKCPLVVVSTANPRPS